MKFHDTLNEKIWDLNTEDLIPEVKEKLEEIAEAFIEFLEIPTDAVLDKVITGSSASYNYNKYSDLDLHIIVDYDKVHEDCPLVNGYLNSLKKQFNDNHDITIHGVPVELYAEQKDQGTVHNGLYSLQTGWIDKPQKIAPTDNDAAVEAKFNEIKELVDKCDDSEQAQELLEKIYNMRKAGLAEAGEFCTENLAFKKLRNEGCMDKLRQIKKEQIDKQLSLESYNEDNEAPKTLDYFINKLENRYPIDFEQRELGLYIFNSKQTALSWDDEFKLIKAMRRGWKDDNDTQKYYAEKSLKSTIKEANKIAKNLRKQAKEQKNKNESIKEEDMDKLEKTLNEAEGIYKPSLIYGAYKLEQQWLKGQELEDGQAPEVMLFIINDPEEGIEDTKFVNKKDIYTYQPKENEFYLDMVRDSGDVITDYNLEPAQKLVDLWNKYKETNMKEEFDVEPVYYYCVEDIDQRGDRFDNAEEAYEQAKEDLTKLGYEVKELNDDAEFDVYSPSTGVAYPGVIYTASPEIDEDVATLIDKVDSAENDLQDIISALETTMTEALEENILQGINEEYETFTVDGVDFSIQNRNDGKVQITQNRPYSMQDWSYAIGTLEEREGKGKWFGKYSLYRNGQFQYPVVTDEKEEVAKWLLRKDKDLEYLPDRT